MADGEQLPTLGEQAQPGRTVGLDRPLLTWARRGAFCLLGLASAVIYYSVVSRVQPPATWLLFSWGGIVAATLWLQVAVWASGSVLLSLWRDSRELAWGQRALIAHGLGLVLFIGGMFVAGALGAFHPAFAVLWPTVLLLGGTGWHLRSADARSTYLARWSELSRSFAGFGVLAWCATAAGAAAFVLLYLQSCTPTAINFDASWYHIPIAQDYAREGRIVAFPSDYNRAFPHLTSMLFTWAFLLPGVAVPLKWCLVLHLEFALVVWKAVGVGVAAAWMLRRNRIAGGWAGLFLFPGVFVYDQNIGGSADHVLGYFAIPTFLMVAHTWERWDRPTWVLTGVFLGAATLTKYQAVYFWAGAGAILGARWVLEASRVWDVKGRLARVLPTRFASQAEEGVPGKPASLFLAPVIIVAAALVVLAPHLVKNYLFYHNPVYPFAQKVFTASYPSHPHSAAYFAEMYANRPYLPKGEGLARLGNALRLVFTFSFDPHYSFTHGVPVIGSLFTLLSPALLLLRGTRRLWLGTVFAWLGVFAWANTYTADRYLQGLITVPAAVTVALIVRLWEEGAWARFAAAVPLTIQLLWSADVPFYSGRERMADALRLFGSTFDGKLSERERFPQRTEQQRVTDATPPNAVILARNYRTTLGIDRTVYSDIQAWQSFIFYEPLKSPAELDALYRSRGVTHLLYPEGQRPLDPLQASVLFADYARRAGSPQKFGSLVLRRLPAKPPAEADGKYEVLVSNVEFYADGLYPVQELKAYERMPKAKRYRAKPLVRLVATNAAELVERADAVVVGPKDRRLRDHLGRLSLLERFPEYRIYAPQLPTPQLPTPR